MKCEIRSVKSPKGLPFYMVNGKAFFEAEVAGQKFLLVSFIGESELRRDSLKHTLSQLEIATAKPVAFAFDTLNDFQRKNLIEEGVPFVTASSIFYLPFLGIAYRRRKYTASQKPLKKGEILPKLTASAQAFFLFMLYKVKDSKISKTEAAKMNGLTPMSVSRYCKELLDRGLIKESRKGQTIQITCAETGRALFDKALPYLDNPVKRETYHFPSPELLGKFPAAGESALSQVSMLAPPDKKIVACGPRVEQAKENDFLKEDIGFLNYHYASLQVWKYDPTPFVQNNRVDTVSLYLSLKDSPNERVQACIKEMLEKEQW